MTDAKTPEGHSLLRDSKGRVLPGRTLNPGGRPRQVRELLALARQSVPRALALAAEFVENTQLDARVRLDAAKVLLGYGLGSAPKLETPADDEELAALRAMSDEELERVVRQRFIKQPHPDAELAEESLDK